MRVRRANSLSYLGSQRRPTGIRHHYEVDGMPVSFFTTAADLRLPADSLAVAAAQGGLANLIDLYSITLPRRVRIEGIQLDAAALAFWERTARHIAAERLVEDSLPASALDATWKSSGKFGGPMRPILGGPRRKLLAMSGGKESLAALKILPEAQPPSLFFLHYPDSSWGHGQKVWRFFSRTHDCHKIRTDITRSGKLIKKYGCGCYGMFVIGQIVTSALLWADRFSEIMIGNEFSANFGNGTHDGVPVNHQYDKSFAFAQEFNAYLANHVTEDFTHSSPFWHWYEYRIAREFFADERYLRQWTSCNNATAARWFCGDCAKCAFVFLLGVAHADPAKIRRLMGANPLENLDLIRSLTDPVAAKPLECVGTKEEAWVALEDLWQKQIWRNTAGLKFYATSVRPVILGRIERLRRDLLSDQRLPG